MSYDKITSFRNERIKAVAALREHRDRIRTGLTIVEGWREVSRAWSAKAAIQELYIAPGIFPGQADRSLVERMTASGVAVTEVPPDVFAKISFGDRQEGILAVYKTPVKTLKDLSLSSQPFLLVVERIEKPGNLGAILRTCDGAGIEGLIVCDEATDIYNPNVIRASIGTVFSVNTVSASSDEAINFLRQKKIKICATIPNASKTYLQENLSGPLAMVLGSEQHGLSECWLKHADLKVRIPMQGVADSLNVSITAAIMMYEARRQRS